VYQDNSPVTFGLSWKKREEIVKEWIDSGKIGM